MEEEYKHWYDRPLDGVLVAIIKNGRKTNGFNRWI